MARSEVTYSCGCGFGTRDLAEASKHCDKTGHKMTVLGMLKPTTVKVSKSLASEEG